MSFIPSWMRIIKSQMFLISFCVYILNPYSLFLYYIARVSEGLSDSEIAPTLDDVVVMSSQD